MLVLLFSSLKLDSSFTLPSLTSSTNNAEAHIAKLIPAGIHGQSSIRKTSSWADGLKQKIFHALIYYSMQYACILEKLPQGKDVSVCDKTIHQGNKSKGISYNIFTGGKSSENFLTKISLFATVLFLVNLICCCTNHGVLLLITSYCILG